MRLDAARKRYAVLKRKLETEFSELDTMEAKAAELEDMRRVSVASWGPLSPPLCHCLPPDSLRDYGRWIVTGLQFVSWFPIHFRLRSCG